MRALATLSSLALVMTLPWTAPVGAAPAGAVAFDLEACAYLEVLVKVPAGNVDPLVPDDFRIIVAADGMNTLALSGASCDHAASSAQTGTGSFVSLLTRIQPPADPTLAGTGVGVYFYRLAHYVGAGDVYRSVAESAGVDTVPVTALGVDHDVTASVLTVQGGALDLRVVAPATVPTQGFLGGTVARWREFHAVPGGYAVLEATLEADADAGLIPAVLTASEGSVLHDLAGPVNAGPASYGRAYGVGDAWMGILPDP